MTLQQIQEKHTDTDLHIDPKKKQFFIDKMTEIKEYIAEIEQFEKTTSSHFDKDNIGSFVDMFSRSILYQSMQLLYYYVFDRIAQSTLNEELDYFLYECALGDNPLQVQCEIDTKLSQDGLSIDLISIEDEFYWIYLSNYEVMKQGA